MGTIIKMEKNFSYVLRGRCWKNVSSPTGTIKTFFIMENSNTYRVKSSEECNEHSSTHQWVSQVPDL